ncbi:MAG: hypothetical protein ABIC95_00660 [archaeon]
MKKELLLLAVLSVFLLSAVYVIAAPPGGPTVTATNLGEYLMGTPGGVNVEAGNITQADLEVNQSTTRWAGLVGNVTGDIVLGDDSYNIMYSWGGEGRYVYAADANSISWVDVTAAATGGEVTTQFTFLSDTPAQDNYSNTFNSTGTVTSDVLGSGSIATVSRATTFANDGSDQWYTYALYDSGGSETVFAGEVSVDGTAFNGNVHDYQMLIPEDGTGADSAVTAWYLWVELV